MTESHNPADHNMFFSLWHFILSGVVSYRRLILSTNRGQCYSVFLPPTNLLWSWSLIRSALVLLKSCSNKRSLDRLSAAQCSALDVPVFQPDDKLESRLISQSTEEAFNFLALQDCKLNAFRFWGSLVGIFSTTV